MKQESDFHESVSGENWLDMTVLLTLCRTQPRGSDVAPLIQMWNHTETGFFNCLDCARRYVCNSVSKCVKLAKRWIDLFFSCSNWRISKHSKANYYLRENRGKIKSQRCWPSGFEMSKFWNTAQTLVWKFFHTVSHNQLGTFFTRKWNDDSNFASHLKTERWKYTVNLCCTCRENILMHHQRPEALCRIDLLVIVIHLKVPVFVFLPLCFRWWVLQMIKHSSYPIRTGRITVAGECSVLQHHLTWNTALKAALPDSSVNQGVTAAAHRLLFFSVLLT